LVAWFDGLRKLQGVPYRYLLADERLLPQESLRFFAVDSLYTGVLLDGAFSSVRAPSQAPEHCRQAEIDLLDKNRPGEITGFLFRSAAVAGWPGLKVTAFDEEGKANSTPLELYHRTQLSPSILLYMFRGVASTVTIEQSAETVHLSAPAGGANAQSRVVDLSSVHSSAAFAEARWDRPHVLELSVSW